MPPDPLSELRITLTVVCLWILGPAFTLSALIMLVHGGGPIMLGALIAGIALLGLGLGAAVIEARRKRVTIEFLLNPKGDLVSQRIYRDEMRRRAASWRGPR